MVRWSKHYLRLVRRRLLGAGLCVVAGLAAESSDLIAQRSEPTGNGAAAREMRAIAGLQRKVLRDEEPLLARRYGRGSPQYVAALHARLEATSKAALNPGLVPTESVRAFANKAPAPVVFPIHEDPRAAKALENQRREMLKGVLYMYGARPPVDDSGRDRFPHTVALKPADGGDGLCSGVLVGTRAILTAQHCICKFKLGAGSEVHFGRTIGQGLVFRVARVASFARRGCPADALGEDLALVFLDTQSAPVAPAAVGEITRIGVGTLLWVAGYGEQEDLEIGEKLTAPIGVVSPICGHRTDPARYGCVAGKEAVLLDTRFGRDSCYGDSGGPAYIEEPGTRRLLLVAVVSRGAKRPGPGGLRCGQGGIYTLLRRSAIKWMVDTISQHERG